MPLYEIVLRREGDEDEVISLDSPNLMVDRTFVRDGTEWRVTHDLGPSQWQQHVAKLLAEPVAPDRP